MFFALVEILNATMQQRDNGTNCLSQMCLTPTSNKFCLLFVLVGKHLFLLFHPLVMEFLHAKFGNVELCSKLIHRCRRQQYTGKSQILSYSVTQLLSFLRDRSKAVKTGKKIYYIYNIYIVKILAPNLAPQYRPL